MKRRVLITGANRGIGLEFVRQYQRAGWEVLGTARHPEAAKELIALGAEALGLDVASEDSVARFDRTLAGRPLDLVINNAGLYGSRSAQSWERMDFGDWEEVLAVNTLGGLRVAQAVLPSLHAGVNSKFVGITSKMGSIGDSSGGQYAYRSSKAAFNSVMVGLSHDWRSRCIVVAVLHPGWVKTDMGGPSALIAPEQSVAGMRRVIEGLTLENSGQFFNYDGSSIPW